VLTRNLCRVRIRCLRLNSPATLCKSLLHSNVHYPDVRMPQIFTRVILNRESSCCIFGESSLQRDRRIRRRVDDLTIEYRHQAFQVFDFCTGYGIKIAVPDRNVGLLAYRQCADLVL
jgi:hypothetical protein